MIDRQSQRNITGYHEAGHAVAAVLRGGWVEGISIEPDATLKHGGIAHLGHLREDYAFVAFAGPWAGTWFQWLGERVDETGCERYGFTFTDRLRFNLRQNLNDQRHCRNTPWRKRMTWISELETRWPVIETVAGLLLQGRHVITALVKDAVETAAMRAKSVEMIKHAGVETLSQVQTGEADPAA